MQLIIIIVLIVLAFKFWPWVLGFIVLWIAFLILKAVLSTKQPTQNSISVTVKPRPSWRTISDFSDTRALVGRMKPTPWEQADDMKPDDRASCFFLPGCNDRKIIEKAQYFVEQALDGDIPKLRCYFCDSVGTRDYADAFNNSVNFYSWLTCDVLHWLHDGVAFEPNDLFTDGSGLFTEDFCKPQHVISAFNLHAPDELRLDDDAAEAVKRSRRKRK